VGDRCDFHQADVAALQLDRRFPLIVGVTVLQHVVSDSDFRSAIRSLKEHLAPEGRLVLLEVAPADVDARHDHEFLRVRSQAAYLEQFGRAGLSCVALTGVDAPPFRVSLRPAIERLPQPFALCGLACLVFAGLPLEIAFGRAWVRRSWHKVFVLEHASGS
jgi:hypothetical protein